MNIKENSQLGNYTVIRKLGSGGMADVFLAYDNKLGREVAIKVLPPEFTRVQERLVRFEKEIKATAQLQHPGLVSVFDMCECTVDGAKLNFFSMSYLSGGELTDKIVEGLTEAEALDIIVQIADALGYAHDNSLIHRDIKPQNILFNNLGKPVISDLGIAKSTDLNETIVSTSGLSIGTPYYMSPEQAMGETDVDGRSDIYALGILLHEMLTGKVPYSGNSGMAVAIKHIQEPMPVLPQESKNLQPLLDKCLAKKKEDRYANTKELIDDVANFQHNQKIKHKEVDNKKPKELKIIVTAILGLVCLLIGVLGYQSQFWLSDSPDKASTPQNTKLELELEQKKKENEKAYLQESIKEANQAKEAERIKLALLTEQALEQEEMALLQTKIGQLVTQTKNDIEALRLTKPEDNNAFSKIEQIRKIAPEHPQISILSKLIENKYVELINSSLSKYKFNNAKNYLSVLSKLSADGKLITELNRDFEKAFKRFQVALVKEQVGELITLPSGEFNMGSQAIKKKVVVNETPIHIVKMEQFRLAKHEVTVGQFQNFVDKTGYITLAEQENEGCYAYTKTWKEIKAYNWLNPGFTQKADHPVVCISYQDALEYIDWLNTTSGLKFRLPSEAEWEYASRAQSTSAYGFGDSIEQLCSYANFADTSKMVNESGKKLNLKIVSTTDCRDGALASTISTGNYKANKFGLVDMHGNASEWTQDCWNDNYLGAPVDGSAWLEGRCDLRVIRGGSWISDAKAVRSAFRDKNVQFSRDNVTSFRLALDID